MYKNTKINGPPQLQLLLLSPHWLKPTGPPTLTLLPGQGQTPEEMCHVTSGRAFTAPASAQTQVARLNFLFALIYLQWELVA